MASMLQAGMLSRLAPRLLARDSQLQLIAANGGPNMSVRTAFADRIAAHWNRNIMYLE